MRAALVLLMVIAAACSKKQDDCQRFVDRSKPVLAGFMKEGGKELKRADLDQLVEQCRAEHGKPDNKDDVLMACVLAAKDDAAVSACWATAFGDYRSKGKKSEAQLQLNKLGKNLKVAFLTDATFPVGKAGPLPAEDCCQGPNARCPVTVAWTTDAVWRALDFQIDEPNLFRYTYESDGKTATATAVGDLDCDGTPITYTLVATADPSGNPEITITEPAPNSD